MIQLYVSEMYRINLRLLHMQNYQNIWKFGRSHFRLGTNLDY